MPDPARVRVKICGLSDEETLAAAVEAGAAYVGFVHFPRSPRHLEIADIARLSALVPPGICKVLLTVDATDTLLDGVLERCGIDMLQLHGQESPERVRAARARHGLPVMKALGVATGDDLAAIDRYVGVADQILVDAKPPPGATVPGGNGLTFDWRLLQGRRWAVPWMLAGGLGPENVAEAIRLTGAAQIDVSSGVERARGVKDAAMIRAFLAAARSAG